MSNAHDHLTTTDIREIIAQLQRNLQQPNGFGYSPADSAADRRELKSLTTTLHERRQAAIA